MKKSNKIKLALLPSLLLIPSVVGIVLTSCSSSDSEDNTQHPNPPIIDPEKPNPPQLEQEYKITFKNDDSFDIGDSNVSLLQIEKEWLKKLVLKHKELIFNIPANILNTFNWEENLIIGEFYANADLGEINFDLTLNNACNYEPPKSITKNINITGFSYLNNKLKDEINKINNINDLQLMYESLTIDEYDFINQDNIIHYLNKQFESNIFEYQTVEFNKDWVNSSIEFKIKVNYNKEQNTTLLPLTSKIFKLTFKQNNEQINYQLDLKLLNTNQEVNFSEYTTLIGELKPNSILFNFNWSVESSQDYEITQIPFTNKASFFAFEPGEFKVNLEVTTKSGKLINKGTINFNVQNEYYKVRFTDPETPIFLKGGNLNLPSTYKDNTQFIKNQIFKLRDDIFTRDDDYGSNPISDIISSNMHTDFINNLHINNVQVDDNIGKLIVDFTLNNATSSGESIRNKIIFLGFNKNYTNEKLINQTLEKVIITPKVNLNELTANEGSYKIHNIFSYDEITPLQDGVKITISSGGVNPQNESELFININGSLAQDEKITKTITIKQGGFMVVKNLGELDKIQNQILKTPDSYTPYKDLELIRKINTNYLDTGDWFSKANKFGWDQYEKELVYHARFILYQSFHDNFKEINYYAKTENNKIHVIAEGIIKNDFNNKYIVQSTQEMWPNTINIKSNEILRVEYLVDITNEKSFYPTTHTTTFSFSNDSMNLDKKPGFWKVFGMQLPGYKLNIQTVNSKGIVTKNWWNHSNNKMRSFIFSIGGSQGPK